MNLFHSILTNFHLERIDAGTQTYTFPFILNYPSVTIEVCKT